MRDELTIENKTKKVEVYQVVLTFLSLLIVVIVAVVNINTRITALEIKQIENDDFKKEVRAFFKDISDGQTKILIEMQNKKNRD